MITIHHVRCILEQCETPQEILSLNDPDGDMGPDEFKGLVRTLCVIGFLDATSFKELLVIHGSTRHH